MSSKLEVVPSGVLLKNEKKHDKVVDIMAHLQQHVSTHFIESLIIDPETNEEVAVTMDNFHFILFRVNRFKVERARVTKKQNNDSRGKNRLVRLVSVIEDWHAKVCFLKVKISMLS
uniref:Uncharacterized protein n=1 Tax=Amphimedon queenslandica TaxID=400682 RepID=A0A1X7TVE2_AMPQE